MFEGLFQSFTSASLLVVTVVLLVLRLFYSSVSSQEKRREPPGPRPLPLLGNLLQLDLKRIDISLLNLSRKYGPVFTVYLGLKKVVVLAGYKTVKKALISHAEEFGERDVTPLVYDLNKGHGIVFTNGNTWKEMRRFALSTLKDLGMGTSTTEEKIIEECHHLVKSFEQHEGKALSDTVTYAASNIISGLVFGRRFEYTNLLFQAMVERNNETIRLLGSTSCQIYDMFPWLGPFLKNRRDLLKSDEGYKEEGKRIIADLKETLNPEMCRCFVDAFLIHKSKLEVQESELKDSQYNNANLVHSLVNLFGAGTDTTATTLRWCLLFMAKYPHIQDQVQEELSRVVGSRQVRVEDRKNLPYTDAVIHESQRFANIAPMCAPHRTSQDVTFQGYFIQKGTTVIPLLTSVLYDESEWESPHSFNPSHFLDKEGGFIRRDAFMPFSAGRRACPGQSLARMELFLFFTSLLQRFRFTPPPGVTEDELDLTPVVGLTFTPSHELCAVRRH